MSLENMPRISDVNIFSADRKYRKIMIFEKGIECIGDFVFTSFGKRSIFSERKNFGRKFIYADIGEISDIFFWFFNDFLYFSIFL